ncbi:hypothetical protein ACOSQ3_003226 [Xanthoceras sorbifolium]
MDKGMDLRHTLLHHALTDVLETEKSEAERSELCDELGKVNRELVVGVECEQRLAAEVHESQVLRKVLELKVKESATKISAL